MAQPTIDPTFYRTAAEAAAAPAAQLAYVVAFDRAAQKNDAMTVRDVKPAAKAGYSRPHTVHCGPDGVFLTCIGGAEGNDDGPGGIALLDHETFDVLRAWETDRGPQHFHYDAWWHLNQNVLISSEWGSP